jgi:hypothetical protein
MASVDAAVQAKLVGDVLRPAIVRAILDGVFKELQPTTVPRVFACLPETSRRLIQRSRISRRPSKAGRPSPRSWQNCTNVRPSAMRLSPRLLPRKRFRT